jgi:hypothetical protein
LKLEKKVKKEEIGGESKVVGVIVVGRKRRLEIEVRDLVEKRLGF